MSRATPRIVGDPRELTRGLRFSLAAGAVLLLLLALALYVLLREYNAPRASCSACLTCSW
ncbi:MAG: hypothetical protein M3Q60_05710 [Actinomycetota bacterium]|nr:hypothetical protein [Actinomycetota bacterium]